MYSTKLPELSKICRMCKLVQEPCIYATFSHLSCDGRKDHHHKLPNLKLLLRLEFVLVHLPSGCASRVNSSLHSELSGFVVVVIVVGYGEGGLCLAALLFFESLDGPFHALVAVEDGAVPGSLSQGLGAGQRLGAFGDGDPHGLECGGRPRPLSGMALGQDRSPGSPERRLGDGHRPPHAPAPVRGSTLSAHAESETPLLVAFGIPTPPTSGEPPFESPRTLGLDARVATTAGQPFAGELSGSRFRGSGFVIGIVSSWFGFVGRCRFECSGRGGGRPSLCRFRGWLVCVCLPCRCCESFVVPARGLLRWCCAAVVAAPWVSGQTPA